MYQIKAAVKQLRGKEKRGQDREVKIKLQANLYKRRQQLH